MMLSCSFLFEVITDENLDRLTSEQLHLLIHWTRNGCDCTMNSLRALKERDPNAYKDLMDYVRDAPLYAAVSAGGRDFFLVHSGFGNFSPERKLSDYKLEELLWHRPTQDERYFPDVTTVLGHTPTGYFWGEKGKMFQTDTWIDIDTGAAGGGAPMLLRLDDLKAFYVEADT